MTQPHEDPFDESRRQMFQALAAMATPVEAMARLYAANKHVRAEEETRKATQERAIGGTERKAAELAEAVRSERKRLADQIDGSWLKTASFAEAAQAWRSATAWAAADDPVGKKAAGMALDRLGEMDPQWKAAYDRHRAAGMSDWEAVRAAAYEVADRDLRDADVATPGARAHPGRDVRQPALPAAGTRVAVDDFRSLTGAAALDAAVRDEIRLLAGNVSPEAIRAFQQHLRSTGRIPPVGDLDLLYTFAAAAGKAMPPNQELSAHVLGDDLLAWAEAKAAADRATEAEGRVAPGAGIPDDRRTPGDEHVQGLEQAGTEAGMAEHDRATAAHLQARGLQKRMRDAFPVQLVVKAPVPAAVADKRTAQVPVQAKGMGR